MATKNEIRQWLDAAPKDTEFMLVICDKFEEIDYPICYSDPVECQKAVDKYLNNPESKIMECYDFHISLKFQLGEERAKHFPTDRIDISEGSP